MYLTFSSRYFTNCIISNIINQVFNASILEFTYFILVINLMLSIIDNIIFKLISVKPIRKIICRILSSLGLFISFGFSINSLMVASLTMLFFLNCSFSFPNCSFYSFTVFSLINAHSLLNTPLQ